MRLARGGLQEPSFFMKVTRSGAPSEPPFFCPPLQGTFNYGRDRFMFIPQAVNSVSGQERHYLITPASLRSDSLAACSLSDCVPRTSCRATNLPASLSTGTTSTSGRRGGRLLVPVQGGRAIFSALR